MRIFGKSIKEHTEEELFKIVNDNDPKYGTLALIELQIRNSEKFSEESLSITKSSRKIAAVSIILSIVVIILSGIAIYSAFESNNISNEWQSQQLQVLEEIRDSLK